MASVPTPRAAYCASAVQVRFGWAHPSGMVGVCRTIIPHDGGSSNTWSEHSWGNAFDVAGSSAQMSTLMDWLDARRARYHIANLIGPGSAVNVVHVDFLPSHAGSVPPCAGGPNVVEPAVKGKNITGGPDASTAGNGCPKGLVPMPVGGHGIGRQGYGTPPTNPTSSTTCIDPRIPHPGLPDWLGTVGRWAEIAGGGILLLAGIGVAIAGGTGVSNPGTAAVGAVSGTFRRKEASTVSDQEYYERRGMERAARQSGERAPSIEGIGERLPRKRKEAGL